MVIGPVKERGARRETPISDNLGRRSAIWRSKDMNSSNVTQAPSAFVAGATGYVGRQVVRRLCQRGVTTLAHIRPSSDRLIEWTERFEGMGATPIAVSWNRGELAACMATHSPTHVFCLLGTTRARAKTEELRGDIYEAVDYRLTSMLIEVCAEQSPAPRIIYLSAIGAARHSRSAYLRARGKIEEELIAAKLSHVSARPAIITGNDRDVDRPVERISAKVGDGALQILKVLGGRSLAERYQSTSATRLADGLVALAFGAAEGPVQGASLRGVE